MNIGPYLPEPFNRDPQWHGEKIDLDKLLGLWHNSTSVPRMPNPGTRIPRHVNALQVEEFMRRFLASIQRFLVARQGKPLDKAWWRHPLRGVSTAIKCGRVGNKAWQQSMKRSKATKHRMENLARAGWTRRGYMEYVKSGDGTAWRKRKEGMQIRALKRAGVDVNRILPPSKREGQARPVEKSWLEL